MIASAWIMACCAIGHYIVVLEKDDEIFKAILQSMKKTIPLMVPIEVNEPTLVVEGSQDPNAMTIKPHKFVRKARPSK